MPVGKVTADQSISLDGFSAGPNVRPGNPLADQGERLHEWYGEGGAQVRDELSGAAGAMVMGRRMFDVGVEPWGDDPPFHMPVFVVTHNPRKPLAKNGGTTYFFVTEGIRDALSRASKAAGDKDVVAMGGPNVIQQFMNAQSYGAFFDTPLETILKNLSCDTIIICGTLTNYCRAATARQGYERGFHVVFGSDVTIRTYMMRN